MRTASSTWDLGSRCLGAARRAAMTGKYSRGITNNQTVQQGRRSIKL
jgi:hypothetical protein